ncbi:helix-turn-helix domain-containing protein [Polymorphospora rubra]|uniref:Transcriptional regulator n=1 Tax=Polymorphospora rubra TaxID=338584 RepID=A0A810N926_9ACTN|nr:helix-turn-helix domain-containing protein [Polymorphospora rubra]BCJ68629.1 transcriptional regulator [Polymorphospora rubra]
MSSLPKPPTDARTQVAERLVTLMELVATGGTPHTLANLVHRAGLPKTTTFRLLRTLQRLAIVERHGTRYLAGPRLLRLVTTLTADERELRRIMMPYLIELAYDTDQVVRLLVLRGGEAVAVERLFTRRYAAVMRGYPDRSPAPDSVGGQLLLSGAADPVGAGGQVPAGASDTADVSGAAGAAMPADGGGPGPAATGGAPAGLEVVAVPVLGSAGRPVAVIEIVGFPDHFLRPRLTTAARRAANNATQILRRRPPRPLPAPRTPTA